MILVENSDSASGACIVTGGQPAQPWLYPPTPPAEQTIGTAATPQTLLAASTPESEVERLRRENTRLRAERDQAIAERDALHAENDRWAAAERRRQNILQIPSRWLSLTHRNVVEAAVRFIQSEQRKKAVGYETKYIAENGNVWVPLAVIAEQLGINEQTVSKGFDAAGELGFWTKHTVTVRDPQSGTATSRTWLRPNNELLACPAMAVTQADAAGLPGREHGGNHNPTGRRVRCADCGSENVTEHKRFTCRDCGSQWKGPDHERHATVVEGSVTVTEIPASTGSQLDCPSNEIDSGSQLDCRSEPDTRRINATGQHCPNCDSTRTYDADEGARCFDCGWQAECMTTGSGQVVAATRVSRHP